MKVSSLDIEQIERPSDRVIDQVIDCMRPGAKTRHEWRDDAACVGNREHVPNVGYR
jgi:hypothetical protein